MRHDFYKDLKTLIALGSGSHSTWGGLFLRAPRAWFRSASAVPVRRGVSWLSAVAKSSICMGYHPGMSTTTTSAWPAGFFSGAAQTDSLGRLATHGQVLLGKGQQPCFKLPQKLLCDSSQGLAEYESARLRLLQGESSVLGCCSASWVRDAGAPAWWVSKVVVLPERKGSRQQGQVTKDGLGYRWQWSRGPQGFGGTIGLFVDARSYSALVQIPR